MKNESLTDIVLRRIGSRPALSRTRLFLLLVLFAATLHAVRTCAPRALQILAPLHSASTELHRIVVGDVLLHVPENLIRDRNQRQRRPGNLDRLDLYLKWPDMTGFSYADSRQFNELENILLVSIETSRNRSPEGELEQAFERLTRPGMVSPEGLERRPFQPGTGFDGEVVVAGNLPSGVFVARCLIDDGRNVQSARCERRLPFADRLVLTYRFQERLLADWRALDQRVLERAEALLQKR